MIPCLVVLGFCLRPVFMVRPPVFMVLCLVVLGLGPWFGIYGSSSGIYGSLSRSSWPLSPVSYFWMIVRFLWFPVSLSGVSSSVLYVWLVVRYSWVPVSSSWVSVPRPVFLVYRRRCMVPPRVGLGLSPPSRIYRSVSGIYDPLFHSLCAVARPVLMARRPVKGSLKGLDKVS